MLKRLLISFLVLMGAAAPVPVASGAVPPFRSDKLEAMGRILGESRLAALPDGENVAALQWQGLPVTVIRRGGVVEHIGYAFFLPGVRQDVGVLACNFLERYALEADLPLPREKSIGAQLEEDGIVFQSGNLATLKEICRKPEQPFFLDHYGSRLFAFGWDGGQMLFPSDAELLLGRSQAENERRLPEELANASAAVTPPRPAFEELTRRPDNILEEERGWYYLPSLRANRYYVALPEGSLQAVDTPAHPGETMANILAGLVDAGAITVQVKRSIYGLKQDYFSIPLRALAGYAQQWGCTPYWGIIAMDEELVEGELILRNEAAGFNHVLRLQVPFAVIATKEGSIQARLTPFVPTHSLKYLFEETRQ